MDTRTVSHLDWQLERCSWHLGAPLSHGRLDTFEYKNRKDHRTRNRSGQSQTKYFDKDPPPAWDGKNPEKTWRPYRREFDHWLSSTNIPAGKHGILLWRALTGDAKLLINHLTDIELAYPGIGKRIRSILEYSHRHSSEFEDQDDFDNAVYGLHRKNPESLAVCESRPFLVFEGGFTPLIHFQTGERE